MDGPPTMLDDAVNKVKKLFSVYNSLVSIADKIILEGDDSLVESYKAWRNVLQKTKDSMKNK